MSRAARKLEGWLRQIESLLLVGLLLAMIGVAVYQVVARNLFGTGLLWGDDMVRVAVLWLTMVGAMAASGTDQHIRIDFITRVTHPGLVRSLKRATNLFTAVLCFALAWFSVTLIEWDYQDQTIGFGAVPAWICELIIPIAACIMGLRYLIGTVSPIVNES